MFIALKNNVKELLHFLKWGNAIVQRKNDGMAFHTGCPQMPLSTLQSWRFNCCMYKEQFYNHKILGSSKEKVGSRG